MTLAGTGRATSAGLPFEIYYDGACPICRREMRLARSLDPRAERYDFVDIAASDFSMPGVDYPSLVRIIHARRGDELISGVEVFREIYARLGLRTVVWLSRLGPIARCLDRIYAAYAVWRMRRRTNCGSDRCAA